MRNITNLTMKEWYDFTGRAMPWWARLLAPVEHRLSILLGHAPVNTNTMDTAHVVPGKGVPRCSTCGEAVGKCDHNG